MIILIGRSGSGKDTIAKRLFEMGMERVVSYTSRPIRPGETNGVEYHFISAHDFCEKQVAGFFAEYSCFKVYTDDIWYYGSAKSELKPKSLMIADPDRVRKLIKSSPVPCMVVHILCPRLVSEERTLERGDNVNEITRRLDADDRDFESLNDITNFAIRNDGLLSISEIAKLIMDMHSVFMSACERKEIK